MLIRSNYVRLMVGTFGSAQVIDHLSFPDFFEFANRTRTRANHDYKLYLRRAVCNCYKCSFFVRIVGKWNDLPGHIVHAESLSVFRSRLKILFEYLKNVYCIIAIKFYLVLATFKFL